MTLAPKDARSLGLATAVVCVLALPFVAKPFQIDDDVYIKGAEQILREPLRPLAGTQRFLGAVMPTYHFTQHPPLVSYYMALVRLAVGGFDEAALHLAFLVFPIAAAAVQYLLARRFTRSPLGATLLLVATPAFQVMADGLMTDLPFLACYLAATAALVYAVDSGRKPLFALVAVTTTLACFVQYRAALLVPLLFAYACLRGTGRRATLLAFCPATILLGLWSWYTWRDLGIVHLLDAGSWIEFRPTRLLYDALGYVSFLGGATLAAPFLLHVAGGPRREPWLWVVTSLATCGLLSSSLVQHYSNPQRILLALFFAAGLATLACLAAPACRMSLALLRGRARRGAGFTPARLDDDAFLLLMIVVPLLSQVTLNLFASVRSLLISLPFLVLFLVRRVEARPDAKAQARLLTGGVLATLAVGLALALADLRFAEAHREVAAQAAAYRSVGSGAWFTGEWGFRHYVERAGFTSVTAAGEGVVEGDTLLVAEIPCPVEFPPEFSSRLRLVATIESSSRFPIKVMSFADHAGFYSNFHGLLPYSFSEAPLERVRVYVVGPREPARSRAADAG